MSEILNENNRHKLLEAIALGSAIQPIFESDETFCNMLQSKLKREIGRGTYGAVYELERDIVVKKSHYPISEDEIECLIDERKNYGCMNSAVLESLILSVLNTVDSVHFPKFYGVFICDEHVYMVLEKVVGNTYTNIARRLSVEQREVIIFQIMYALYQVRDLEFYHGDLIGQNIMIEDVDRDVIKYEIEGKKFQVDNLGLNVRLIDFGFSRITHEGKSIYNETIQRSYYQNKNDVPFSASPDICKIIGNPNLVTDRIIKTDIYRQLKDGNGVESSRGKCKYLMRGAYPVIQPFPDVTPADLFRSDVFDIYLA